MRHVVGPKDIIMMPSIVDVAGINRISAQQHRGQRTQRHPISRVYANAAGAIAGMLGVEPPVSGQHKPLVTVSMFGNTTPCVDRARGVLTGAVSLDWQVVQHKRVVTQMAPRQALFDPPRRRISQSIAVPDGNPRMRSPGSGRDRPRRRRGCWCSREHATGIGGHLPIRLVAPWKA